MAAVSATNAGRADTRGIELTLVVADDQYIDDGEPTASSARGEPSADADAGAKGGGGSPITTTPPTKVAAPAKGGARRCVDPRALVAVSLGAILGVLARIALKDLCVWLDTVGGADGATAGATALKDFGAGWFLPNLAGCAVMGCALLHRGALAARHATLLVGITTGFCGCCTTFATWNHDASRILVGGRPQTALFVLYVGWLAANEFHHYGEVAAAAAYGRGRSSSGAGCCRHRGAYAPDLHRHALPAMARNLQTLQCLLGGLGGDADAAAKAAAAAGGAGNGGGGGGGGADENGADAALEPYARVDAQLGALAGTLAAVEDAAETALAEARRAAGAARTAGWSETRACAAAALVALVGAEALLLGLLFGPGPADVAPARATFLLSLALAPLGGLLRYLLGLLNQGWPRFPLFTFVANVGASCLTGLMATQAGSATCVAALAAPSVGGGGGGGADAWACVLYPAVATGFCGSLSTVSTFVAECRAISTTPVEGKPPGSGRWDAARYALATFAAAQLLLLPINGIPQWK